MPQLVLADRLDRCVDELSPWLGWQPTGDARERYLDLMVGLCTGAEAMRALARGDVAECMDHLESSVRHLDRVQALDIVLPASDVRWD